MIRVQRIYGDIHGDGFSPGSEAPCWLNSSAVSFVDTRAIPMGSSYSPRDIALMMVGDERWFVEGKPEDIARLIGEDLGHKNAGLVCSRHRDSGSPPSVIHPGLEKRSC